MSLRPIPEDAKGKRKRELPLEAKNVNMVDLDPRDDTSLTQSNTETQDLKDLMRLQPAGDSKSIQLREESEKIIKIGSSLSAEDEAKLVHLLQQNKDLLAWTAADMPGIDLEFCCHHLNVYPGTKPVA